MSERKYSVYSLPDVKSVIKHKSVGTCVLSDAGGGEIAISWQNDLASVTTTATGYCVVNKLVAKNGSITLQIPQNSDADIFLQKWADYLQKSPAKEFALSTLSVVDPAAGETYNFSGVVLQRKPDKGYQATSGNRQYNLLFVDMVKTSAA